MKRIVLLILLSLCLLLVGCGAQASEPVEPEAEPALTAEPTEEPTPEPVKELVFPNGSVYQGYEVNIRLEGLKGSQVLETMELLRQMPNLLTVDLGRKEGVSGLSFNRIEQLQAAFPDIDFLYRYNYWDTEISTLDTQLDLKHIKMDDEGALVSRLLRVMPYCRSVDMDSCGVSSEAMAALRESFPEIEINWRIWFGREFSVRTDVERIIATNYLNDENCKDLQYCTKVRFLDIGHNPNLTDISFLANMPDLEVAVLAIMPYRDLTPLTNCTKMEYLELCEMIEHRGKTVDLSPLAGMTHLHHLNICKLYEVENYECLETFTELERLWIGKLTYIPMEYIEHLKEVLPDTTINWWTLVCVTEKWREDPHGIWAPRYQLLREQFDYNHYATAVSYWWNDPLCEDNNGKDQKKRS